MVTTGAFLVLMLVGVPISLCLCLSAIVFIWNSGNPLLFQSFPTQLFGGVDQYGLLAIPLFILIGEVMNGGGITQRLVGMATAMVGAMRGGLAYVNLLANMLVSSILGSATAQVAIMARSWSRRWSARATTRPSPPASPPMRACSGRSSRPRSCWSSIRSWRRCRPPTC